MKYIWQQKDWPKLKWDSRTLLPLLSQARKAQGVLLAKVSGLGLDLGGEAQASILTEETIKTSAIEGERLNPEAVFMISASTGDGVADLKSYLASAMPAGPWQFPADQLSDATDRMVAAEITREQLYLQLHAELPYASAVETEKWEDRRDGSTVIHQQILVERDSQKAIVVGKGGAQLKKIGQTAREAIADHLGRKVHLFLHVKVNPKCDEDRSLYKDIGLEWSE